MFAKLDDVERRYEEIISKLADPAVTSKIEEMTKLMKERAKLDNIVRYYREYRRLRSDLDGAKEILESNDDAMREMAKAEMKELTPRLAELEEKLTIELLPKDPMDEKNVVMEIRAGAGGDEASLFAG